MLKISKNYIKIMREILSKIHQKSNYASFKPESIKIYKSHGENCVK